MGSRRRGDSAVPWLCLLPALLSYAAFVVVPFSLAVWYSLHQWSGVGPATWRGLRNYGEVLTAPEHVTSLKNAAVLILFFTVIPVSAGLALASLIKEVGRGAFGSVARTVLFLPQIVPLVAAGIAWSWMYARDGVLNQLLRWIGLGSLSRPWLGDFDTALYAVGLIGSWLLTGFCTVLLLTGIGQIDGALYESLRLDGGGWLTELRHVTLPGLRHQLGVLITITMISALATFDVVFITTQGGPGRSTTVPGVQIYRLAFTQRRVGEASALGLVLMALVIAVVWPVQRLTRERHG